VRTEGEGEREGEGRSRSKYSDSKEYDIHPRTDWNFDCLISCETCYTLTLAALSSAPGFVLVEVSLL
jgi:hypothetical protein